MYYLRKLYSEKIKDQIDIVSLIKTFYYNTSIIQKDSKISFQEQFVTCFKNISTYNTTNINELNNSLIKVLLPKKHLLENQFKLFDVNNTGLISFVILKKIINITQIELTNNV